MNRDVKKLEAAVRLAGRQKNVIPEPGSRWQMNLMRAIRLTQPQKEPVAGLGPVAWKWAGAALTAAMILSLVSSHYGELEEYLMLQSEITQSADYLLAQSL